MSNLKMYILVKRSAPIGLGANAIGHTALATYLRFQHDQVTMAWVTSEHFRKVTCIVSDEEFEKSKKYGDFVVMTEDSLDDQEIAIGFKPRETWPNFFRFLKLYGSHLREKE
jgi:hypothetical protein